MVLSIFYNKIFEWFCYYESVQTKKFENKFAAIIYRITQLCIIFYLICYSFLHSKCYQKIETGLSTTSVKLKGISYVDIFNSSKVELNRIIFDQPEYDIGFQESSFSILTNYIQTTHQQMGKCVDIDDTSNIYCWKNEDCTVNEFTNNGIKTGNCVPCDHTIDKFCCEIFGWCPLENDKILQSEMNKLHGIENFTVFIKNQVEFPEFNFIGRNIPVFFDKDMLKYCRYNSTDSIHKNCPIFKISTILDLLKLDLQTISYIGGSIAVKIKWDCDFDVDYDRCMPTYSFKYLDEIATNVAPGLNFRFSRHFKNHNNESFRDLYKAFILKFLIITEAKAGKFDLIIFLSNLGSGIGLFGLASLIGDLFLSISLKKIKLFFNKS